MTCHIYECIVKEMHVEKKSKIKQIVVHYSLVPILGDEKKKKGETCQKILECARKGEGGRYHQASIRDHSITMISALLLDDRPSLPPSLPWHGPRVGRWIAPWALRQLKPKVC